MNFKSRMFTAFLTFVGLLLVLTKFTSASEGDVDLNNRVNTAARCAVRSVFKQDLNYHLLFSCRDITYPGGVEVVNYVMWANPTTGGSAFRLGTLGLGKGDFRTKTAFNSLFVTIERDQNVRTPTGQVIMQGNLRPIASLEGRGTTVVNEENPLIEDDEIPEPTLAPTAAPRTGVARFLTGGIVAFLGLAAIIFILFVITKR